MAEQQQATLIRSLVNLAIASVLAYGIFLLLGPMLLPIITGVIISTLSRPLYRAILRVVRLPGLAALITVLVALTITLVPLAAIAASVLRETSTLNSLLTSHTYSFDRLNQLVNDTAGRLGFSGAIDLHQYTSPLIDLISAHASLLVGSLVATLISAFLAIVTAFYMLQSQQEFQAVVLKYSPLDKKDTKHIIDRAREVVRATVLGNVVMLFIQAATSCLGFYVFGLSTPVLLGILYGVTSLVPSIGSALIWVPVVLFELIQGNTTAAIGIASWALAQVIIFDHYVGPVLIERRAHLHPFLILLGVLGGVSQFGAIGIVLGPTMIALGIVGLELIYRSWQRQSEA
ncbi:MAG: AI-2E family transporter [bacterium]